MSYWNFCHRRVNNIGNDYRWNTKIISLASAYLFSQLVRCLIVCVLTQMTVTECNSSVPQRQQRRLPTAHIAGVSTRIPVQPHTSTLALIGTLKQQQHNNNVLMCALLTQVALLSIMVIASRISAGGIVKCVDIYTVLGSRGLKLSDLVTLRQVHKMSKCSFI